MNVFEIVTDRIVKLLESGTVPWRRPWDNGVDAPRNIDGYEYNGINFFLLSMLPFKTPVYLTLNQIKKKGGTIKEGENKNHAPVFYWRMNTYDKDKSGNPLSSPVSIPMARYTQVWNIEQVDGIELPKRFAQRAMRQFTAIESAEKLVANYKDSPAISHGGNRACYTPVLDKVTMPEKDSFKSPGEYYSTLFHELGHSTGHAKRLNRKELMDGNFFGSHDYSVEELVAEMSAAYMAAHCGIDNTLENSAAYIASWSKKLRDEPRMLMTAAARAQKAFKHIAGAQELEETATEE
jgi:antirestriction protein ArdC